MTKFVAPLMFVLLPVFAAVGDDTAASRTPSDRPTNPRQSAEDSPFGIKEDADGITVLENGKSVYRFQRSTRSLDGQWPRAGYVHPLYSLHEKVITEDFPSDHRHHRGVFWAWHQVWVGDRKMGDPWLCKDFVWDVIGITTKTTPTSISLNATVDWKSPHHTRDGKAVPIVREETTITSHVSEKDHRLLDFRISLLAKTEGVRIGGSEDVKGYGGFSPRLLMSDGMRFRSASGPVEPIKTAVEGDWIDISGKEYGIAMLPHPSNPEPRDRFILRRKRSMQNAMYPGREPVPVSSTDPVVLRYRLVVHDGDLSIGRLTELQNAYDRSAPNQ